MKLFKHSVLRDKHKIVVYCTESILINNRYDTYSCINHNDNNKSLNISARTVGLFDLNNQYVQFTTVYCTECIKERHRDRKIIDYPIYKELSKYATRITDIDVFVDDLNKLYNYAITPYTPFNYTL